MHRSIRLAVPTLAVSLLAACGGSASSASLPPGYYVTVGPLTFSPASLAAPAGATITVVNSSAEIEHSVTQEAAVDAFTPGAPVGMTPFDTGLFSGGTRSFVLPAGLPEGTVLYFYCRNHMGMMVPSTGRITIAASAPPAGGGGGY
jgi:plastocyanin